MQSKLCECGHSNPYGTSLCQACGKPLDNEVEVLSSMRYEGSARRSQTYKSTIVDRVWNFFSSVKVGVWLIVTILVAAAIGTIFPQEMFIPPNVDPASHYESEYGTLGFIYYLLGFHNLYGSWWFIILLGMLGLSIIIASLDRGIPLYKALKTQRVTRHDQFMKNQRLLSVSHDVEMEEIKYSLETLRYKVREEEGNLFAEKGRFSRWGAYVNHVGLIIFLTGAMLRFFPGMYVDEILWVREGEKASIPGTKSDEGQFYLENNDFILEMYDKNDKKFNSALSSVDGEVAKNYQSNVTLYKTEPAHTIGEEPKLLKVKDGVIRVNEPFKFDSFALYQTDFKLNEFYKMSFKLEEKSTGKFFGDLTVDLHEPETEYDLGNGYRVEILDYYPNFVLNEHNQPATVNNLPDNPAFVFAMYSPSTPKGEKAFVGIQKNIESGDNQFKMSFAGIETKDLTALTVRKDHTLWIIALGGIIFMIGVTQGLYWNYRRIWIKQNEDGIWAAAHTNKNWYGLKKDLEFLSDKTNLTPLEDKEIDSIK
ncbi:cytochrome c biogenesis protein ResB [Fictibacillus nanhaiensis]|uniref:cytochrome c biogenesis protein ResB n=1 Tax=Fictibacillus nanhaiensis TaxID=742169 RepID=UPI0023ED2C53|nr:cytochrome c biogenesis protein ResB [Fictibacillus nanhaiensis]